MGSERHGGRGMPMQMAVGDKERLLGRDGGDEELMCSGLTARRASLTTSHSPPSTPTPIHSGFHIQRHFSAGKVKASISKALFWILGNLVNKICYYTLFDTSLDRKCDHVQFLFFHPTSTWVTTGLGKQEWPPAVPYSTKV